MGNVKIVKKGKTPLVKVRAVGKNHLFTLSEAKMAAKRYKKLKNKIK